MSRTRHIFVIAATALICLAAAAVLAVERVFIVAWRRLARALDLSPAALAGASAPMVLDGEPLDRTLQNSLRYEAGTRQRGAPRKQ